MRRREGRGLLTSGCHTLLGRIAVVLACLTYAGAASATPRAPTGLLCERMRRADLSVITTPSPKFGWIVEDPARGAVQSGYQILTASSEAALRAGKPDLWDSG